MSKDAFDYDTFHEIVKVLENSHSNWLFKTASPYTVQVGTGDSSYRLTWDFIGQFWFISGKQIKTFFTTHFAPLQIPAIQTLELLRFYLDSDGSQSPYNDVLELFYKEARIRGFEAPSLILDHAHGHMSRIIEAYVPESADVVALKYTKDSYLYMFDRRMATRHLLLILEMERMASGTYRPRTGITIQPREVNDPEFGLLLGRDMVMWSRVMDAFRNR